MGTHFKSGLGNAPFYGLVHTFTEANQMIPPVRKVMVT